VKYIEEKASKQQ